MTDQRAVVVTGVSTGIGWGVAKVLIGQGITVYGSVRKQADADRLSKEFGDRFKPLLFDVTDEKAVAAAAEKVRGELAGKTLFGLVNNAGIAVGGPLLHLSPDDFRKQLEVNLTGVLMSTQAFAPLLGADLALKGKAGRIVNIGSVGGRNAFPFMGPYHVTKFGIEGFTESLRRELMVYDIDAIVVAPGSVVTPIWDKAEQTDYSAFDKTDYKAVLGRFIKVVTDIGQKGLPPEKVGETVLTALTTSNPKTRYTLVNSPIEQFMTEKLPRRWVDGIVARRLGIKSLRS